MTQKRVTRLVAVALLLSVGLVNNGCLACLLAILSSLAAAVSGLAPVLAPALLGFAAGNALGGSKGKAAVTSLASADGVGSAATDAVLRDRAATGASPIEDTGTLAFDPESTDYGAISPSVVMNGGQA